MSQQHQLPPQPAASPATRSGSFLRSAASVIAAVVAFGIVSTVVKYATRDSRAPRESALKTALAEAQLLAAQNANKQVPIKLDDATTLIAVTAVGTSVVYNHRLSAPSADIDRSALAQALEPNILRGVCSTQSMLDVMKIGGAYHYRYLSSDNIQVAEALHI